MAQLGNLLVKGSSRFLNKAYFEDISIAGTSFFSDNISTDGTLNIGANKASNALLYLNKKIAIRGVDSWLRINDTSTNFTSGVYFGSSDVRTDKAFQVGDGGKYFKINSSSLDVNVPSVFSQRTTHNGGLISPTISSNLISFVKNGNTLPKIDGADATAILNELTVLSTLRAKEYELDHVQNLGGTFMVSPSFICTEGSTSVTVSAISGSEVTFVIKDNATLTKTEIATASWVLNSQIKLSGKIGNTILANATGTITKSVDTNNHTITVKVDVGSSTVGNFTVNTTYSGSQVSKLALMMFRNASGYRLGIYLESYSSENKKPVINIFDGSGTDPKVVLGKLDGTPKVNNVSPTGYGLYSDNAFLKGTIIATSGTIGGFTLSTDSIQNGTFGQDGSVMMCLGSNNSASIGGSGNINGWTFTAGSKFGVTKNGAMYATSGKIGKYTITDSCLTTGGGSVCTGMGGNQAFWAGSDSSNDAPFHVSYDGSLYASKANISGVINSTDGNIGGWKIGSNKIESSYTFSDTDELTTTYNNNILNILSETASIDLTNTSTTYPNSSDHTDPKNCTAVGESYLSLKESSIRGRNRNTIYGIEENEENDYSFSLNAINGLEMRNNISKEETTYACNGITFPDKSFLNSAKCRAGLVAHYWNSNGVSCGTKSGNYVNLTSFSNGTEGKLSELYYKKSNYQIAISRNGVYSFQTRLGINSPTANKRVEVALFKNGSRYAAYSASYSTPVDYTLCQLNNYILYLSEGDTIDFRIAPIDGFSVNVTMVDVLIYALDYDLGVGGLL